MCEGLALAKASYFPENPVLVTVYMLFGVVAPGTISSIPVDDLDLVRV